MRPNLVPPPHIGEYICKPLYIPRTVQWLSVYDRLLTIPMHNYFWDTTDPDELKRLTQEAAEIFVNFQNGICCTESEPETMPAPLTVGMIIPYAGVTPLPEHLLMCDGSTYTAAAYPELYAAIHPGFKLPDAKFTTPDMRGRTVFGADPTHTIGQPNLFNSADGERTTTLQVQHLPAHDHGLEKLNNTTFGQSARPAAGQINTGTVATTTTQQTGGNIAHNNMPPYRNLWWVIVAKSQIATAREIVISSEAVAGTDCNALYWRYSDEPVSSNRYLATTCDGETGATGAKGDKGDPGAQGEPGECPDCTPDGEIPVYQEPTPEEYPPGQNYRCLAAASMVGAIKITVEKGVATAQLSQDMLEIAVAINSVVAIFTGGSVVTVSAALTAVGSAILNAVIAGLHLALDYTDWQLLQEMIYCSLDSTGRLDPVGFDSVLAKVIEHETTNLEWIIIHSVIDLLQAEGLNNAARLNTVTEADCTSYGCGWGYWYFGYNVGANKIVDNVYVFSLAHNGYNAANTYTSQNQLRAGDGLGYDGFAVKVDVGSEGQIIDRLEIEVATMSTTSVNHYLRIRNEDTGQLILNRVMPSPGGTFIYYGVNAAAITIECEGELARFTTLNKLRFSTPRPLLNTSVNWDF